MKRFSKTRITLSIIVQRYYTTRDLTPLIY
jgi:hypothetical protein